MDETSFKQFLVKAHRYCLPRLKRLTDSEADAEDVFMEAAYQFWKDLQTGKINDQRNLKALLFVMAKNKYISLMRKRKRKSLQEYSTDPQIIHLHERGDASASFDQLVQAEEAQEAFLANEERTKAFQKAFQRLEKKCRELLEQFILEKKRLKELQQQLNFPSADAVKMAKYRCKKQLVDLFQDELAA
jgi:RNA polymerase sigma factor (sigma-70 family)